MLKLFVYLFLICSTTCLSQSTLQAAIKLYGEKQFDRAKPLFEKVVAEDPKNTLALERLGDIAGNQKKWKSAISYYRQLTEISPSKANYHYKFGGALGMEAKNSNKFKALGMIPDVRQAFETAIALDPNHIEARYALIELNLQLPAIVGGSIRQANKYASELQRISPVDGHLAKARIAEYGKDFDSARQNYSKAVKLGSKTAAARMASLPRSND